MSEVKLLLGDCLELMKDIPDGSIDAVITDPPYNVGKDYGKNGDNRQDYKKWCSLWIEECFRTTKDTGIVCIKNITRNLPVMFCEMDKHGTIINQIIWRNVSANHSKKSFWNAYESILVYSKTNEYVFNTYIETQEVSKPSWSKKRRERQKNQMRDIWDDIKNVYSGSVNHPEVIHADDGSKRKAHPCQQPIGLSARIIRFFTNDGDTILDLFTGSGTTGVACVQTGRNFIGMEIEPKYFEIAKKRIHDAQQQMRLPI